MRVRWGRRRRGGGGLCKKKGGGLYVTIRTQAKSNRLEKISRVEIRKQKEGKTPSSYGIGVLISVVSNTR